VTSAANVQAPTPAVGAQPQPVLQMLAAVALTGAFAITHRLSPGMNTMSNRTQPHVPAVALGTAGHLPYAVQSDGPREHPEDSEVLTALAHECAERGITLTLTDTPALDTPLLVDIDGRSTLLTPSDELDEALYGVRRLGRCIDCLKVLDATATPYADGYTTLDGSPLMICRACRDEQAALASVLDPVGQLVAALPTEVPAALAKTIPSCSNETVAAIVEDLVARLTVLAASPAGGVR